MSTALAQRSVDRALAARRAAYGDEVRRLVDATFALVRDSGELEPRVGAIVRAAGLSNQAFYRHFRSKDELLVTVLDDGVRQLADYLAHRMERAASPRERVRAWIAGVCQQALDAEAAAATRPFALSRARLSELFPNEVAESERQLTDGLRRAIEAARQDGGQDGEQAPGDARRDAQVVYGLAMGWLQQQLGRDRRPDAADAEHLIDFALRGLGFGGT
ncbi:MAG: TetR/AcrR family transcriptional regulator [Myxococcota bacterium]